MDDIQGLLGLIDTGENDRRAAIQQGLLATGLGLLGSRNPRFAGALGEAGMQGIGAYQQHMATAPQQRIQQLQVAFQLAKMAEEQRRRAAMQKALAGLPEDQRVIAEMAPDEFAKAKAGAMFPKPGEYKPITREINMGGEVVSQEFDPATRQWMEIARGPRWNPNPPAAAQINLQAPTFMVGPDGQTVMLQPNPKGGAIQTPLPGLKPQPQPGQNKLPAEIGRMTIAMDSLQTGLDAYEQELRNFDPRSTDAASPEKRARIESLVADLRMQAKEAQALGALTGPDVEILNRTLTDPATVRGAFFGQKGLNEQIKMTREAIKRRRDALVKNYPVAGETGVPPAGGTLSADELKELEELRKRFGVK